MSTPQQVILVPHLRWSAESFQTLSRSRVDLADVLGRVLDALESDPALTCFVLDGQAVLLEDYLAAVPAHRLRLTGLVRSGALVTGPWFTLPDPFLCGGESLARNLLYGTTTGLGRIQTSGYLPGRTAHVAQLPQLLDLAGLDSFLFTGGERRPFRWSAPNGSRVLAVSLQNSDVPAADGPALLCFGGDHTPPPVDFDAVLTAQREAFPLAEVQVGAFRDFLAAARAHTGDNIRPGHRGELLEPGSQGHFGGAWSARMYQKQANEACQTLLGGCAEPLLTVGHFLHGDPWPGGLLDLAWRDLLRCHTLDALGGRGTDSVHKDLDTRLAGVRQTSEQLLVRWMDKAAPQSDGADDQGRDTVITVANPLPVRRDEVVERLVVLPPLDYDLDQLRLLDEDDRQVAFRIVDRMYVAPLPGVDYRRELFCEDQWTTLNTFLDRFDSRILGTEADRDSRDCFLTIQFLARDLPGMGHRQYLLTDEKTRTKPACPFPPVSAREDEGTVTLENETVRVTLNPDGTFDLENTATGRRYDGLNLLEDTEDCGDAGDYAPAPIGGTFFSGGVDGRVRLVEQSDLLCRAEAAFKFIIPRSMDRDRRARSQRTARCDVRVTLTLRTGSSLVEVETDFNNHAFDHRLRAWFPTGLKAEETLSDGAFHLDRRPLAHFDDDAPTTWPQQAFTVVQGVSGGLAVFNRGLPEFQAWAGQDGQAVYALTLLRCVDWLSRDDLAARRDNDAGPTVYTPDAQCYGPHTFRYAVAPCARDPLTTNLKGLSDAYRLPPVTHQGGRSGVRRGGTSLLEKSNPQVTLTAVKKAATGNRLIVRLCNLGDTAATETLRCGLSVLEACQVDLLEQNMVVDCTEPVIGQSGLRVDIALKPFQIITLALTLDTGD